MHFSTSSPATGADAKRMQRGSSCKAELQLGLKCSAILQLKCWTAPRAITITQRQLQPTSKSSHSNLHYLMFSQDGRLWHLCCHVAVTCGPGPGTRIQDPCHETCWHWQGPGILCPTARKTCWKCHNHFSALILHCPSPTFMPETCHRSYFTMLCETRHRCVSKSCAGRSQPACAF